MYIDIEPNDNLEEAVMATFNEKGQKQQLSRICLWRQQEWQWCAIAGWHDDEPCSAHIQQIEESGDGDAMLVTGGNQGLRLARIDGPEAAIPQWDLDDDKQWAEGFLLCTMDIQFN